ncbi:ATP synthase F1 subunit delta [Flaviaesturariibacter amylovorans]|uniref:ATP synthase subunit delta n=1 Tax=Flaviaesturariibacter amylovorans TaxID=1084520 RepID=A0ABP8G5F6_9BACT
MLSPRLASRYAKSLLDLAIERGQLETVYADMQYLRDLIRSSRDLAVMLKSPVISSEKKQAVINAITAGNIGELTLAFTRLLIAKHREGELVEIVPAFMTQYRQYKGIHIVKLTTAAPVSEAVKTSILSQVRSASANIQQIELETAVNPDLIGGFVLQTGDQLVDASVAYELKEIGRQFDKNDFIYKII